MDILRTLRHLLIPTWWTRRAFGKADLNAIRDAIAASEVQHAGELRFVLEGSLPLAALWCCRTARQRAAQLFAQLGVWDTEANSGILIYVQLVDRRVEILADRGIAAQVPQAQWDAICRGLEAAFRAGDWRHGVIDAVVEAGALLIHHFPAAAGNRDELPNEPVVM